MSRKDEPRCLVLTCSRDLKPLYGVVCPFHWCQLKVGGEKHPLLTEFFRYWEPGFRWEPDVGRYPETHNVVRAIVRELDEREFDGRIVEDPPWLRALLRK